MNKRFIQAPLLIVALSVACSPSTGFELEGHIFDVPEVNAISDSARPFFLPRPEHDEGFSFYLNPEASLADQNIIGVASKERMCVRAIGREALINSTVCAARPLTWQGQSLHRVVDGVFWTYNLPGKAGQNASVALVSCFAMDDDLRTGLCTANLPYDDLILTIHLQDKQMPSLLSLYQQSITSLRRWKR